MEKILNMDYAQLNGHGITIQKKSPALAVSLFVVGGVLFALSLFLRADVTLSSLLLLISVVLCVTGAVMFFGKHYIIRYSKTGEAFKKNVYFFETGRKSELETLAANGCFDKISGLSVNNSTLPLMLVTYSTSSGSCVMYQMFQYVPHTYEPVGDMKFFYKEISKVNTETDGYIYSTAHSGANLAHCGS